MIKILLLLDHTNLELFNICSRQKLFSLKILTTFLSTPNMMRPGFFTCHATYVMPFGIKLSAVEIRITFEIMLNIGFVTLRHLAVGGGKMNQRVPLV